jgi:hypothetical protein
MPDFKPLPHLDGVAAGNVNVIETSSQDHML